jgi:hypothetical protein
VALASTFRTGTKIRTVDQVAFDSHLVYVCFLSHISSLD